MAVQISGVLKDGAGKPIQNCTIQLKAKRNSTTVLVNTVASENPDEAGRYSMDVEYGQYSVILLVEGFPPSHAGTITVYEGSRPGTLNDFLGAMTEDDVMPEALRRFEEMVEEAARNAEAASQSAAAAKKSETAAASSKNAAKTSETNAANSAQAAATSKTASANSATAAKKSETNAKNSETAAKTSETNAKSSQTAAKTSETNAKTSETAAKNSQVAAAQSESAAAGSATSAAGSATAAANSQKAAKTSETNAKSSQTAAKTSETNAKASETAAKNSQTAAAESESAAAGSASAAAASATASANSQKAAKTSETNAKTSETAAANSAKASAASQTAAKASEDAAREYASQAAEPYKQVLQPLPDVWIPFNDSMDMITGFGPGYKKITVRDDVVTIPSDKIVPFSRASSATYINKSGALTIAEINEPRFEKEGLLIEGQRTNYFANSNAPELWASNAGLSKSETKTDGRGFKYATFTPGSYLGTSGTYGAINGVLKNKIAVVKDDTVTISFRAKGNNVRFVGRFDKGETPVSVAAFFVDSDTLDTFTSGADASNVAVKNVVRDGEWIAVEVVYKVTDESTYINGSILMANKSGVNFDETSFIEVTTPQIEKGPCASSFIISGNTPTTRASDMVIFSTRNNISSVPLSCLVEIHKNWDSTPNQAPRILTTIGVATNDEQLVFAFRTPTSPDVEPLPYVQFGVRSAYLSPSVKAGRKMIAGFVCNSSTEFRCCCNGYLSPVQTSSWKNTGAAHEIRIGGTSAGGERHLFGHVRNLRIWHKELTDAQMGESIK
ncbi:prophage tail fiber N-terminal domain-containing protein [Escherichia coli]|uniref:prophage tail fiber N-terminal domain-containing protein n=1 Tax=Escherichia coli TaxID=562 RepID=UPI0017E687DE|nr:prophage tail fiber N-terminal domain-containing protein [Escherichia coli]MBC0427952.1 prophage tail fiber N-terminal domain-containing protein [Escherichia coli]MDA2836791.1 prophage tail fiber N-terminal domain-containing protein [Escherichia coli]